MKFTLKNVFNKRIEFELACKNNGACKEQYKKLVSAKNKKEFMQVIYDNFSWCYNTNLFDYDFDWVSNFDNGTDGLARVTDKNKKQGLIKKDGSYAIEPKFDIIHTFSEGFAAVHLNGLWGFIKPDGSWFIYPMFYHILEPFQKGAVLTYAIALVKVGLIYSKFRIDSLGNIKFLKDIDF